MTAPHTQRSEPKSSLGAWTVVLVGTTIALTPVLGPVLVADLPLVINDPERLVGRLIAVLVGVALVMLGLLAINVLTPRTVGLGGIAAILMLGAVVANDARVTSGARIDLTRSHVTQVTASSTLAPAGSVTYSPENTIDTDRSTAWNSDARGIGQRPEETSDCAADGYLDVTDGSSALGTEWLQWHFDGRFHVERLEVANGYQREPWLYEANHRVRGVAIETDSAREPLDLELEDVARTQLIELTELSPVHTGPTGQLTLRITSIWCGTGEHQDGEPFARGADVALSEIAIHGRRSR